MVTQISKVNHFMNAGLQSLLKRYRLETITDYENALKEIIQELALLGLWRARFYEHAAFYGGTALRIFYQLPRFSEDLDFSLIEKNVTFALEPYLEAIRMELSAFGFEVVVEKKNKAVQTTIESAFIKGETSINLLHVGLPSSLAGTLPKLKQLKIKLEIDIDPPKGAVTEMKTLLTPIPFSVRLYTPPCLFAGKLHAVLCRQWKTRVKGRDYYDFLWYLGQGTPCHLEHLKARMVQTGHWEKESDLTINSVKEKLVEKFHQVDFENAKSDVRPFIEDAAALDMWSSEFFIAVLDRLKAV